VAAQPDAAPAATGRWDRARESIKKALYKMPVIHGGGYRSKTASRKYVLDKSVLDVFE